MIFVLASQFDNQFEFLEKLIKGSHPILLILAIAFLCKCNLKKNLKDFIKEDAQLFLIVYLLIDFGIRVLHIIADREPATRYYLLEILSVAIVASVAINHFDSKLSNRKFMNVMLIIIGLVFTIELVKPRKSRQYIFPIAEIIKNDKTPEKHVTGESSTRIRYYAGIIDSDPYKKEHLHLYVISGKSIEEINQENDNRYKFSKVHENKDRKGKPIFLYLGINKDFKEDK